MKTEKQISSWARAVYLAIEENPTRVEEIFLNLKKLLGLNNIKYLPFVVKKFCQIYEKEKRVELIVSSNFDEKLKIEVKERLKESIKGIEQFSEIIDDDLIAGFRLKTKDVLIKASLKDTLTGLKNKTYGHN